MSTWGSYQSLIQLGAALNFGYAAYEFLLERDLKGARLKLDEVVAKMMLDRANGANKPALSGARHQMITKRLNFLKGIDQLRFQVNGFFSLFSGIISVVILFWLSIKSDDNIDSFAPLYSFIFFGYGWFTINLLVTGLGIAYLNFFIIRPIK